MHCQGPAEVEALYGLPLSDGEGEACLADVFLVTRRYISVRQLDTHWLVQEDVILHVKTLT